MNNLCVSLLACKEMGSPHNVLAQGLHLSLAALMAQDIPQKQPESLRQRN